MESTEQRTARWVAETQARIDQLQIDADHGREKLPGRLYLDIKTAVRRLAWLVKLQQRDLRIEKDYDHAEAGTIIRLCQDALGQDPYYDAA